uniref:Putative ovule protein n=1 Tax=Solanum chacoense TaxID=4108 RepID=A0A0V0GRW8_SOLCH
MQVALLQLYLVVVVVAVKSIIDTGASHHIISNMDLVDKATKTHSHTDIKYTYQMEKMHQYLMLEGLMYSQTTPYLMFSLSLSSNATCCQFQNSPKNYIVWQHSFLIFVFSGPLHWTGEGDW